ncbi:MAG: alpha/beta hydrolase [Candidatus Omnitrophota bacterium]
MKILPARIFTILICGVLFFSFAGCLTLPSASERLSTSDTIAQGSGFHRSRVHTTPFTLTAYSKIQNPGQPLHIYIEGDGYAWVTRNRVSGDPTPRRPVALELAAEDPAPNVIYLARPCQYTPVEMNAACEEEAYWIGKRFSEEVIGSMNQAIDKFAKEAQSSGIHLIGYSGGGAVAALIAVRRQDVKSLRTVAGNLDPKGLDQYHEVSPLSEASLDPMEVAEKLRSIPQYHFVGTDDTVVPVFVAEHFVKKVGDSACVQVKRVSGVDHVHGWVEAWPRLLKLPMNGTDSN